MYFIKKLEKNMNADLVPADSVFLMYFLELYSSLTSIHLIHFRHLNRIVSKLNRTHPFC